MGVEKFFNTLLSSYKTSLITEFKKTSADILFFDFNSIIHKISASTVSDLNYLYKILLISQNFPSQKLINFFINKYKNYENIFYLPINFLHTPTGIKQLIIDLKKVDINSVIIYQIIKHIEHYISKINNLQLVYISIDGVPSIGKIMEQRHRKYIGEIVGHLNNKKIQKISKEFENKELSEEYPYDYFDYNNTKFTFNKFNISPATSFMKMLIKTIKHHNFPVKIEINDDTISGEGEYKIINFIRIFNENFLEKKIIIYSPDSDMILLSSLLPHDIYILRYDQQKHTDYIMSTDIFKVLLTKYIIGDKIKYHNQNIINDIIFIFTIFGDDFIPKIEAIQVNYHYEKILEIYKEIYKSGYILEDEGINLKQLKLFFIKLSKHELPFLLKSYNVKDKIDSLSNIPITSYVRKKESSFNDDPLDGKIINKINKDIHDSNYLEENYSAIYYLYDKKRYYSEYKMNKEESSKEYVKGLVWLYNYYFKNKLNYSWYYDYEKAPFIEDIVDELEKINNLDELFKDDGYPLIFTPIEQAIYTSPINITNLLSKKYQTITKKFYSKYKLEDILNKIENLDCKNSAYLSKCSLLNINHPIYKMSPIQFIKEFRTYNTSNQFLKFVKYYKITNDPYFYDLIKKLI